MRHGRKDLTATTKGWGEKNPSFSWPAGLDLKFHAKHVRKTELDDARPGTELVLLNDQKGKYGEGEVEIK